MLCVYSVFGDLTMAAPMGHLTIKFNSVKFNSLGLLSTVITRDWELQFNIGHVCIYLGPFTLHRNCVGLPHCTFLHRNCDVFALRCRMKVKIHFSSCAMKLRCFAAESNQYIGTATQLRYSMNGPFGTSWHINFIPLWEWTWCHRRVFVR